MSVMSTMGELVAVGTSVTQRPPHRSRRAALPHRAPALGCDAQTPEGACRTRQSACDRIPRHCVRLLVCSATFPLANSLPSTFSAGPMGRPLFEGFLGTMELSDSLHPCITVVPLGFTVRTWRSLVRPDAGPPGFRTQCFCACQRSPTPPGACTPCHDGVPAVAFRVLGARRHPDCAISGLNTLPAPSPVNASPTPLPTPAHDSGPVWLAGPSLSGTCTLQHSAGLSRRIPNARGEPPPEAQAQRSRSCRRSAPVPCSA